MVWFIDISNSVKTLAAMRKNRTEVLIIDVLPKQSVAKKALKSFFFSPKLRGFWKNERKQNLKSFSILKCWFFRSIEFLVVENYVNYSKTSNIWRLTISKKLSKTLFMFPRWIWHECVHKLSVRKCVVKIWFPSVQSSPAALNVRKKNIESFASEIRIRRQHCWFLIMRSFNNDIHLKWEV